MIVPDSIAERRPARFLAGPACKETRVRNLVSPLSYGSGMDSAADAVPRGYCIGYGRGSTREQNPGSQRDALELWPNLP
jgi:hypothetical protein